MKAFAIALLCLLALHGQADAQSGADVFGDVVESLLGKSVPRSKNQRVTTGTELRSELRLAELKRLQTALTSLGFYDGPIDGEAGPSTWKSVTAWAAARGWQAPKTLRPAHLKALEDEAANGGTRSAAVGEGGDAVSRVQAALSKLRYYSGPIDGRADAATTAAVAAWARDRGWAAPAAIRDAHAASMEDELARRAPAATAAPGQGWQRDGDTIGSRACTREPYMETCLRLACDLEDGLGLHVGAVGSMPPPGRATLVVDDRDTLVLPIDTRSRAGIDPLRQADLVTALSSGQRVRISVEERSVLFSLVGFASEFTRASRACDALRARLQSAEDPFAGAFVRLPDELAPAGATELRTTELADVDLAGMDIRHGLADPLLRGLDSSECARLCSETQSCKAMTFNPAGSTCFLKSGETTRKGFAGVRSTVFEGRKAGFAPPPTRGPGPLADPAVGWREGDDLPRFQERVRNGAAKLGSACEAERATLDWLARTLAWSVRDDGRPSRVGERLRVEWSGNDLQERIPAWLMVESGEPARFFGKGHVALGPDAPNPFAIRQGLGRTRALVLLATRGAGAAGSIEVAPLREGAMNLTITLVGYLRACRQEVVLKEDARHLEVSPAPAEIVLNTPEGRAAFTHRIELPKFSRRVLLNENRFLLLDAANGAEIVERAGAKFQVSPTHRFIAVEQNGRLDVVDVVDGQTAATLDAGDLRWALGDSIAFSTSVPWAMVNLVSTFGDHLRIGQQLTGPSCCMAEPGNTRVGVDLENAAYSIWGHLGYRVGALQNPDYASISNAFGGYSSEGGESVPLHLHTLWSLGMVAPVSVGRRFDVAGGFETTGSWDDWSVGDEGRITPRPFAGALARALYRVSLKAIPIEVSVATAGAGPAEAGNSAPLVAALPEQLRRIGLELDPMVEGERLLDAPLPGEPSLDGAYDRDKRLDRSADAMNRFRREAEKAKWRVAWALPTEGEEGGMPDCGHVLFDNSYVQGDALTPRDVLEVATARTPRGAVWVARAACVAGATLGSLRPHAAFYVMDLSGKRPNKPGDLMVEGQFNFENAAHRWWYDHPFHIKANDDLLLTYAPGNGVVTLRDRLKGKILWIGENLPNGDLLVDAWATRDRRHVVQLNSDGNFHIHALAQKSGPVLSGRITDDEVAVWTADYHYDATAEAAALIDLKFPGKSAQFSLDRFGASRRVPDLARAVIDRGEVPAPTQAIGVPPSLAGEIALEPDGRVRAVLRYDPARTTSLSVLQDGVVTGTFDAREAGGPVLFERVKDARWISVIGFDREGLASLPVLADLGAPPRRAAVNRVLAIGINTYEGNGLDSLNYPLRDAGRIIETLTLANGAEPPFANVAGPKDRRATPPAILDAVKQLVDGLALGDHAVLFLAGHGLQDDRGRFYLATSRTDPDDLAGTALPFDQLASVFEKTEARITVLLDACHSGAAGTGTFATNDDLANKLTALRSNLTVLAAAKGRQESLGQKDKGGLFSDAIARVLGPERPRFDRDRNGRIEASELYRGVKALVVESSAGQQTPWIAGTRMVGEYALF